jgi:hypothetical protein
MADGRIFQMTAQLESWNRTAYVVGGGEPFLFYVAYGNIDPRAPLSRSKYRCEGIPEGVSMMSYGPDQHPEVPGSFREGYLWDQLQNEDPELAGAVELCDRCIVLRGAPDNDTSLNYLRDTIGLISYLLDHGGCAIYDPQMLRWWSAAAWQEQASAPASAVAHKHTVILVSDEEDSSLKWYHTRGMRKFGRPDISVHNVPALQSNAVVNLCNRLIEHLAAGHIVADGQDVRMPGLPPGTTARNAGHLDDPDFNNVHLDIQLGKV